MIQQLKIIWLTNHVKSGALIILALGHKVNTMKPNKSKNGKILTGQMMTQQNLKPIIKQVMTMAWRSMALIGVIGALPACSNDEAKQNGIHQTIQINAMNCPDDGPRLAKTGLCVGRAVNYMNIAAGDPPYLPKNCDWVVNETQAAAGEYLLYLAARCSLEGGIGKPATLEFKAGAKFAEVDIVWSGLTNQTHTERLALVGSAAKDLHQNIMAHVLSDFAKTGEDIGSCHVVNNTNAFYAKDALVVQLSDTDMDKLAKNEPAQVCGTYGLDQENAYFWRVFQGTSWFITMNQDVHQEIDPRSFTFIEPDGNGGWQTIEAEFFE